MKLKCTCGTESCEFAKEIRTHIKSVSDLTGFGFIWDISNGLSNIWLCPVCTEKVYAAWNSIIKIAGTDYISIPILKPSDDGKP